MRNLKASLSVLMVLLVAVSAAAEDEAARGTWGTFRDFDCTLTLAAGVPVPAAFPCALAVSPSGAVAVADWSTGLVSRFDADGNLLGQFGGHGGRFSMPGIPLPFHLGLAADAQGRLYVADPGRKVIQVFTAEGEFLREIGPPAVSEPFGVAVDSKMNLYVIEWGAGAIKKLDAEGVAMGSVPAQPGSVVLGGTLCIDRADNVWTFDTAATQVLQFDSAGELKETLPIGHAEEIQKDDWPWIAVDGQGRAYVAFSMSGLVFLLDEKGEFQPFVRLPSAGPIAVGPSGDVWVLETMYVRSMQAVGEALGEPGAAPPAETEEPRLHRYDATGAAIGRVALPGPSAPALLTPWGVAVDAEGRVFVGDRERTGRALVKVFDPQGTAVETMAVPGEPDQEIADFALDSRGRVVVLTRRWLHEEKRREYALCRLDGEATPALHRLTPAEGEKAPQLGSLAVGRDDRIYLADTENNAVVVYSLDNGLERLTEATIRFREEWGEVISISYHPRLGLVASTTGCEMGVGGILRFDDSGDVVQRTSGRPGVWPQGALVQVVVSDAGDLYAADAAVDEDQQPYVRILHLRPDGTLAGVLEGPWLEEAGPCLVSGLALGKDGSLYVALSPGGGWTLGGVYRFTPGESEAATPASP